MDERIEQGRRFLMGYRDDDTTEFVSDQEKKLPQPPLCKIGRASCRERV